MVKQRARRVSYVHHTRALLIKCISSVYPRPFAVAYAVDVSLFSILYAWGQLSCCSMVWASKVGHVLTRGDDMGDFKASRIWLSLPSRTHFTPIALRSHPQSFCFLYQLQIFIFLQPNTALPPRRLNLGFGAAPLLPPPPQLCQSNFTPSVLIDTPPLLSLKPSQRRAAASLACAPHQFPKIIFASHLQVSKRIRVGSRLLNNSCF